MYELKDFQKLTVEYIYQRLKNTDCHRFLCADEVGLGKTIIAKGLIDNYLKLRNGNLKVFYICSSQYLAKQNLKKLHPENQVEPISRLTDLITRPELTNKHSGLSILPLSPKTSVDLKSRSGLIYERVYLYRLLKESKILKGRRESSFERVLGLNIKNWHGWISWVYTIEFDEKIKSEFIEALQSDLDLIKHLEDCFDKIQTDYRKLIGKLRMLLATVSLNGLKPDIIILDEFQRFSEILKQSESEDASDLINALFKNDHTEMLMLSATPYKMYTIREEDEENESHFEEFRFLMKFLMREDYKSFLTDWENYSNALLSLKSYSPVEIGMLKIKVEKWLYKYMCRTERGIVYESDPSKTLIEPKYFDLPFGSGDVANFISADNIVKCIQQKYPEMYSPLEYSKTVPFPISFMDEYKLKTLFEKMYDKNEKDIQKTVALNEAFINFDDVNSYRLTDFRNGKMNWLVQNNVHAGANILWIPPCIPYYKLSGPFKDAEMFSKLMIFGRFAVEPRAIATLASYAAELYSTGSQEATLANKENKQRLYYTAATEEMEEDSDEPAEEKKKYSRIPRRRLNFKQNEIPYSLYCFYYPSLFLSSIVRETLTVQADKNSSELLEFYKNEIKVKLSSLDKFVQRKSERTDVRWYLFALIYLDYTYCKSSMNQLSEDNFKRYNSENNLHPKLNKIAEYINIMSQKGPAELSSVLSLGDVPEDLPRVLSSIALGSPAVLSLVTFQNGYKYKSGDDLNQLFLASMSVADSFRSCFNSPEAISVIDIFNQGKEDYWLSVMDYCISGCLISVLDECFYMYCDGNYEGKLRKQVLNDFIQYLSGVLGIRTASLTIDMVNAEKNVIQKSLRTHYALAFMDQVENDDTLARKGNIQDSFNSPFRPFILATTSIGQEGLDFHKYCRQLMHWSLPGNAIDLEQREGRINRYKHFALRKNLAVSYNKKLEGERIDKSIWSTIFNIAENDHQLRGENCQLIPFWHVPKVSVPLERLVPTYPYSKDVKKLNHLLKTLTVYRMSLGQPNQEDLVRFLLNNFTPEELNGYKAKLIINLSPVAYEILEKSFT